MGHKAAVARLSAAACKLINDTLLLWLKGGNKKKKTRDGPMSGKQRYAGLICGSTAIERAWREPGWAHLTSPHRYDCCTMGSATGQITCAFTRHKEKACVCAGGQRNRPRLEFQCKGDFTSPPQVAVSYTKKFHDCQCWHHSFLSNRQRPLNLNKKKAPNPSKLLP